MLLAFGPSLTAGCAFITSDTRSAHADMSCHVDALSTIDLMGPRSACTYTSTTTMPPTLIRPSTTYWAPNQMLAARPPDVTMQVSVLKQASTMTARWCEATASPAQRR